MKTIPAAQADGRCAAEPIHIPGAIQPHGVLLVLDEGPLTISHVSANAERWLGLPAPTLLGVEFLELLPEAGREAGTAWLMRAGSRQPASHRLVLCRGSRGQTPFEAVAHRHDGRLLIELEPQAAREDGLDALYRVRQALSRLRATRGLQGLLDQLCHEVRAATGYARVMVYRFDPSWSGQVVAEARAEGARSCLGLHYPASDIPAQARAMYAQSPLRNIVDVHFEPVPLLRREGADPRPVDMSMTMLRSVSPAHIAYLRNMGIRASLSVSLLSGGRLWGIVTCSHDAGPIYTTPDARAACELVGELASSLLAPREYDDDAQVRTHLEGVQGLLRQRMAGADSFAEALTQGEPNLLDVAAAHGAAIVFNGRTHRVGEVPDAAQLKALLAWLATQPPGEPVITAALPEAFAPAAAFGGLACGLIAIPMSRGRNNYVLFFRREQVQEIRWGGDPGQPLVIDPETELPRPRASFAPFIETVRGRSAPWRPVEREAALQVAGGVVDLVLQQGEDLVRANTELARSNVELDAFAYAASHDLKEPLRGIHNYVTLVDRELAGSGLSDEARGRLGTVVRLTHHMESLINSLLHYAHVGRLEIDPHEVPVRGLVEPIAELLRARAEQSNTTLRLATALPRVSGDPVLLREVFSNLMTNALKYNDKAERLVEVGSLPAAADDTWRTFYVRDNGIGIRPRNLEVVWRIFRRLHGRGAFGGGTGTGLTIARRIVERHGGRMWLESTWGEGSTFFFTLPAAPGGVADAARPL